MGQSCARGRCVRTRRWRRIEGVGAQMTPETSFVSEPQTRVPIKKIKLTTTGEHATKRLDHVLADWLPQVLGRPVPKAKSRKLIMAGAVSLNGRPLRIPSKTLSAGSTIEAHIDVEKLFEDATSHDKKFELTPDRVLFEDEDLIVIDKPSGLPSQPTLDKARDNLF